MRTFDFALIFVVIAGNILIWLSTDADNVKLLTREHGILENAQTVLLILSSIAFLFGIAGREAAVKSLSIAFAALCFVMLFREIDWRRLNVPDWLVWTESAPQRDLLFIGLVLAIAAYLYWQRSMMPGWIRHLSWPRAWTIYACGALLMVSFVMDVGFVGGEQGRRWEEMVELDAYIFLLVFALQYAVGADWARRSS